MDSIDERKSSDDASHGPAWSWSWVAEVELCPVTKSK